MCIHTLAGIIKLYPRLGGLVQPGNRFVSFVRSRAAACKIRMDLKNHSGPFPFPFWPGFFPFSLVRSCVPVPFGYMRAIESKRIQVSPSESKCNQVSPSESE